MDYRALGQRIKEYREHLKLTQRQVASLAGLSASFLGHIERGTRVASVATLLTLASILETTPDMLLGISERYGGESAPPAVIECLDSMRSLMDRIEAYYGTKNSRRKRTHVHTGERE